MKSSELADYSVGTVWHVQDRGRKKNLVDVVRGRFEYPDLVTAASLCGGNGSVMVQHLSCHRGQGLGIEPDPVSQVRQDLRQPIHTQSRGRQGHEVHGPGGAISWRRGPFREDAPWLDDLVAELLGFPGVRHDDQVDSVSQALAFITWRQSLNTPAARSCAFYRPPARLEPVCARNPLGAGLGA